LRAGFFHSTKVNQYYFAILLAADQVRGLDVAVNNLLLMDKR
jgi:hypothetical protein